MMDDPNYDGTGGFYFCIMCNLYHDKHPDQCVLDKYRSMMNHIHAAGNIYYDAGRMEAYSMIAKLASNLRKFARGGIDGLQAQK